MGGIKPGMERVTLTEADLRAMPNASLVDLFGGKADHAASPEQDAEVDRMRAEILRRMHIPHTRNDLRYVAAIEARRVLGPNAIVTIGNSSAGAMATTQDLTGTQFISLQGHNVYASLRALLACLKALPPSTEW